MKRLKCLRIISLGQCSVVPSLQSEKSKLFPALPLMQCALWAGPSLTSASLTFVNESLLTKSMANLTYQDMGYSFLSDTSPEVALSLIRVPPPPMVPCSSNVDPLAFGVSGAHDREYVS